ncbi:MAG: hypothetical protein GY757_58115 [bacterium]|nr:hypothetical protein [bacterium]
MISLPALETQKTITQYKLDIWQEKQGFAHNSVVSICQTRDGYIWLGTLRGLVRFDGIRFTTFKKDNTVELKDNVIKALFEDHKGTLWIGTSEGGLSCLKKGVFKNYSLSECKGLKEITTIFEDREGTLWIGTLNSGLSILKNGRFKTHTTKDGLPADRIRAFCENKDGALLIATSVGLIIHSYPDKYRFYKGDGGPFEKYIIALCNTGNDGLWIGCNDGLYLVKEKEIEYYGTADGLPNPVIKCLYKDKDGNIWGGTDGGGLIRLKNGRLEIFSSKDGLGSDSIYSILEDREGCIWLGTLRGGLHRLRDTVITPFTTKEGLSHNMVTSLSEEKDGGLWVGMKGGGVNRLEGPIVTLKLSTKQGLLNNNVNSVVDDGNGSLWIATDAGLNQFRDDKMTGFTTRSGLSHNNTQDVWSVKGGALWIYTLKNLDRFNNGVISVSTEAKVLHKKRIQYIHEKGGETWFATDDGLYKLNNGTLTAFTISEGLVQNEVECIHEDKDGILYIGTRGGLSRMAEGEFCNVTTHTGLADSYVRGIAEDDFGYLWLAGRTGISRIDKKELDAFALGKINRLNPDLFNESDGMKNPWCEECIKTRDGRLWFTTDKGIVMIEPTNIKTNTLPPPVKIEELIVDGDKVNINGPSHSQKKNSLVIPPGNKRMEFYYAALSFIKPRKIKFKLKLDGFDNNWIDAGSDRKTTYTGLSPGNYTFRVTACNCDGVWNKEGTSLSFYIKPYFYQTPWFYVTVSLFLLLSVFTFYRFRIRQLKAREKELSTQVTMRTKDLKERNTQLEKAREKIQHTNELIEGKNKQLETQSQQLKELNEAKSRFFANISHEFRTPLTLIMGPLEQILAANPDTALKNQAHLMLRNSHRLLNQVNQLLDLAKFDSGKMKLQAVEQDIVTFMKSIVLCFESLAQQENVTLEFQAKEETLPLYFDPDKLEKVLLNLLSNAFKYTTSGGSIRVLMRKIAPNQQYPEGFVVLTVQDTGTGIPPDQLPHIFERFFRVEKGTEQKRKGSGIGLALTKDLVELHHGTIAVIADEEKGIGTEFTISLPLGKSHLDPLEIAEPFPQSSESPTLPEIHQERKRIISNSSNELLRSNNGVPRGTHVPCIPWPAGRPPGGPPEAR